MDDMNQQQQPSGDQMPMPAQEKSGGSGAMIGAVVVIVIIVALGAYVFMNRDSGTNAPQYSEEEQAELDAIVDAPDQTLEELQQQGSSDEIADIEADIDATDLDNLDQELGDIEGELNL